MGSAHPEFLFLIRSSLNLLSICYRASLPNYRAKGRASLKKEKGMRSLCHYPGGAVYLALSAKKRPEQVK